VDIADRTLLGVYLTDGDVPTDPCEFWALDVDGDGSLAPVDQLLLVTHVLDSTVALNCAEEDPRSSIDLVVGPPVGGGSLLDP
tara:strand:+ start:119 stop:367 length:249 start_codon:yes stop_codon:yes gene_type:complete